jgi:hypothetical protein
MSDEIFRGLAALVVAARGGYAFPHPAVVAALARAGWCTPHGELTRGGEDAFARAQAVRAVVAPLLGAAAESVPAGPASLAA